MQVFFAGLNFAWPLSFCQLDFLLQIMYIDKTSSWFARPLALSGELRGPAGSMLSLANQWVLQTFQRRRSNLVTESQLPSAMVHRSFERTACDGCALESVQARIAWAIRTCPARCHKKKK